MERISLRYLYTLSNSPAKDVIEFCWSIGLICSSYNCPKCGKPMKLAERVESLDHYEWRCRSSTKPRHSATKSIRSGSWFSGSQLTIPDILLLTHYFVLGISHNIIKEELCLSSATITEWRKFFREVCLQAYLRFNEPIGGKDTIIELDVKKFEKLKAKDRKASAKWVLGGVQRHSNNCFFQVVEKTDTLALFNILKTLLLPGTTVYSNCWESSIYSEDKEFKDISQSCSFTFKEIGSKTNYIESAWRELEQFLPCYRDYDQLDTYLCEYMWRRRNFNCKDLTREFFKELVLNPPESRNISTEISIHDQTDDIIKI